MKRTIRNLPQIKNRQLVEEDLHHLKDHRIVILVLSFLSSLLSSFSRLIPPPPSLPLLPFPSLFLPLLPPFRPISSSSFLPSSRHLLHRFGGLQHLFLRHVSPFVLAACTAFLPSMDALLTPLRRSIKSLSSSHDRGSSFSVSMTNYSIISPQALAEGLLTASPFLLQEADAIGIGSPQVSSWPAQPLTQASVNGNLSQLALCPLRYSSALWESGSQVDNGSESGHQQALQYRLSRLAIPPDPGIMAHMGNNPGLQDFMKNLRRVYELTAIGVKENRDSAKEIKGLSETICRISQDVSDNGARTEDLDSNLRELLGRVERIEADLQRLVSMNQESRVNGNNTSASQPMEEESVQLPRQLRGN